MQRNSVLEGRASAVEELNYLKKLLGELVEFRRTRMTVSAETADKLTEELDQFY
jgi:hypothetical protein